MDIDLIQATRTLARGDTARIGEHPDERLLVVRGRLWLTREADPKDYVLGSGESFSPGLSKGVVITALEDSAFAVLRTAEGDTPLATPLPVGASIESYRRQAEAMRARHLADTLSRVVNRGVQSARAVLDWVASGAMDVRRRHQRH